MNFARIRNAGWLGVIYLILASCALGQSEDPPDTNSPMPPMRPPDALGPGLRPDVYLLRNAQGEPIAVPRVGYEEYERRMRESIAPGLEPTVAPSLSQLDVLIEPQKEFAKVVVVASLRLNAPNKSWLNVPLGLTQLQWIPSADGIDRNALSVQSNGYVWRLEPNGLTERQLKFEAVCKLTTSNNGDSLRLDLPSTSSVIRLKLAEGDWELTASGSGNEVVEPFQTVEAQSTAVVRTTATTLNLSWNRREERQSIAAVEATSLTKFTPSDDGSQIKGSTTISFRGPTSLAGKRFSIRLPKDSQLRDTLAPPLGFSGYRILPRPVQVDPANPETASPQLWIDVDIDESFSRTELDIPMEWQSIGGRNPEQILLEAPVIEGAQSHTGTLECMVPRTVVFDWKTIGSAKLLRQSQSGDGSNALAYTFQFQEQPAGVASTWQSLTNRPRIRSSNTVEIREQKALLRGRIEFASDPTQLPQLQLDVSGWTIESVTVLPSQLELERSTVQLQPDSSKASIPLHASFFLGAALPSPPVTASIPAASASNLESVDTSTVPPKTATDTGATAPSSPSYSLEYTLTAPLPAGSTSLAFRLPQLSWLAQDSLVRLVRTPPGTLTIKSWNFRFASSDGPTPGLVVLPPSPSVPSQELTPFLLAYQVAESPSEVDWKGTRSERPTSTSVSLEVAPQIVEQGVDWDLRWNCRSWGGRPESIRLGLPQGMQVRSVSVDEKIIPLQPAQAPTESEAIGMDWFECPLPAPAQDATQHASYTLAMTAHTPVSWNSAALTPVRLTLPRIATNRSDDVVVTDIARARTPRSRFGTCTQFPTSLDPDVPVWEGSVSATLVDDASTLDIEGEWVQTILNAIYQRDRYVARFRSNRDWIDVQIPASLRKDLEVLLDGKRVSFIDSPIGSDHVRIELRRSRAAGTETEELPSNEVMLHVLEIFTLRPGPEGWLRSIRLQSPRLSGSTGHAPLVWQVIVPRTEHLVWRSSHTSPLYRWQWRDLFFTRQSEWGQERMEKTLGATSQPPVMMLQTNQYDLSTFAIDDATVAWFVPRSVIWLPVAALILFLSIGIHEHLWLGRPWMWAAMLIGWMLFSQWAWDVSILVTQTLFSAMLIVAAYSLMRWVLNRRARRRSIFVSRSTSVASSMPRSTPPAPTGSVSKESPSKSPSTHTADAQVLEDGT